MSNEPKPTVNKPQRVPINGRTRRYYLHRLDRDGFTELAQQVRDGKISAAHAAKLAGFGDNRRWPRKDQIVVDAAEWRRLQRRVQIGENGWPQKAHQRANSPAPQKPAREGNSPAPAKRAPPKLDVRALIA
jgi:hypothetical protein